jgi:opacity protein-like surface antigen
MMTRQWRTDLGVMLGMLLAAAMMAPAPASAQVVRVSRSDARHTINFNLGYFAVRGEDSRVDDDVLLANILDLASQDDPNDPLAIGEFSGATFGGEWLYAVTDYIEAGAGVGFYQNEVPTTYRDFQDSDGSLIDQDLKLRIVPITATVRFLPLGRGGAIEPYVGAGIGIFNWRYSEVGEFIDFSDFTIFPARFTADGTAVGPVILAGLRAPIGDAWSVGGEIRWQSAEGDGLLDEGFLTDTIDLGGWTTSFTFGLRF